MAPKWFLIARTQYRIYTSSFRKIRPIFPFLVVMVLALFVWYIAPKIISFFVNELIAFLLSQVAVVTLQVLLFMFSLAFVTLPITYALRDIKTEQQWIFLSSPVRPSDVLLGEFFGELPLYAILIVIITGFITAVLDPLGIDMTQKTLIVIVFLITLTSALWIGTVIAALLRTRLGRSAYGKDMGKALSVIIMLPVVGLLYAFIGGNVLGTLTNPQTGGLVKTLLMVLPSTWGAKIISSFASNPGNTGVILMETAARLAALFVFFGVILWVGIKVADRAYSIETTTFTAAKATPDGTFYKIIRSLGGGGSSGTLLASTFKVYSRRLHNLSWLAYVVCLIALLNIFIMKPDEPIAVIMLSSFAFALLAAAIASDVTIRGKDTLFIYKKTPSGIGRLVKTRLVQGWLTIIPIVAVIMTITILMAPQVTISSMGASIGLVILIAAALMVFALGLFLLMPVYTEKAGEFMLNMMIIIQGTVFLFIGCLIIFGETRGMLLMGFLMWVLGIVFVYLGKRHLSRME